MLEQQTQTDTMDDDGHCGLDGMIIAHQQEQALGQDQDTVSDDGIEEAAPSDLLFDDIFLLDSAISMIDQLVPQIAAARNDRHSISDMLFFSCPAGSCWSCRFAWGHTYPSILC